MKLPTKPRILQYVSIGLFVFLAVVCWQPQLVADQFILRDGRVLTGAVISSQKIDRLNPDKKSALTDVEMTIEIDAGVQIVIHKSDIILNGHLPINEQEVEYAKGVANLQDTAEKHYALAQECTKRKLKELAQAHFLRAIDLNPDHAAARAAVEHKQSDSGRWIRLEDRMHAMGKVEVAGRWIYPETAKEDQLKAEETKNNKAVRREIQTRQQEYLRGGPKSDQALAALEQINDPIAVEVFAEKLSDKKGAQPIPEEMKLIYVRLLANFDNPLATQALAKASVFDGNPQIRNTALDVLSKKGREMAIGLIVGLLNPQISNNDTINRAAYALGKLNATEATLDLIYVLVTKHEVTIAPEADTFSAGGLTKAGPKKALVNSQNEEVRNALAQTTGQGNLGFDKAAWLAWYASVYAPPVDDLRRDF